MPAWCSFARVKVRQLYTLTKSNPQNASVVLIRAIQSVTEHFDEVECSERQRGAHPRFQSATVIRFDEVECSERQRPEFWKRPVGLAGQLAADCQKGSISHWTVGWLGLSLGG